jgi:hypothetical protein
MAVVVVVLAVLLPEEEVINRLHNNSNNNHNVLIHQHLPIHPADHLPVTVVVAEVPSVVEVVVAEAVPAEAETNCK